MKFGPDFADRPEEPKVDLAAMIAAAHFESDGWCYRDKPTGGDARKFVTLEQDGMTWVGIRAFHFQDQRWMNNNEPERAHVKAWREMPELAQGWWDRGQLRIRANTI